jgi:hypothetical protein
MVLKAVVEESSVVRALWQNANIPTSEAPSVRSMSITVDVKACHWCEALVNSYFPAFPAMMVLLTHYQHIFQIWAEPTIGKKETVSKPRRHCRLAIPLGPPGANVRDLMN